uniref:Uncharacterized protein n=1 Tax=Solanum lycopersicum TaxID=4081 RepID=A0A3Q7H739_SOLLC
MEFSKTAVAPLESVGLSVIFVHPYQHQRSFTKKCYDRKSSRSFQVMDPQLVSIELGAEAKKGKDSGVYVGFEPTTCWAIVAAPTNSFKGNGARSFAAGTAEIYAYPLDLLRAQLAYQ